jgi:hypothetical protein
MGEGRGKLESLIGELEAKKAELEKLIQEYELMLPHLAKAREALDDAGITATAPAQPEAAAPQAAAPAPAAEPAPAPAPAPAEEPAPAAEEAEPAPARRSIASLVAEDDAAGDEATH